MHFASPTVARGGSTLLVVAPSPQTTAGPPQVVCERFSAHLLATRAAAAAEARFAAAATVHASLPPIIALARADCRALEALVAEEVGVVQCCGRRVCAPSGSQSEDVCMGGWVCLDTRAPPLPPRAPATGRGSRLEGVARPLLCAPGVPQQPPQRRRSAVLRAQRTRGGRRAHCCRRRAGRRGGCRPRSHGRVGRCKRDAAARARAAGCGGGMSRAPGGRSAA